MLVGRHPRENDELTRSAADADLWFHARGCPGSHTVLRVPASGCGPAGAVFQRGLGSAARGRARGARRDAPHEDVIFAASLAAFFSKARNEGKPAVIVARAKDVSKPRGAPPGLVVVAKERVVVGRPAAVAALALQAPGGDIAAAP